MEESSRDLNDFGRLLHEAWMRKRALSSSVSNGNLDHAYDSALEAGAVGGKLLGAGGGGFLLFYVEPHRRQAVIDRLKPMVDMSFGFENSGASVVLYNPDLETNYDASTRHA